MWKAFLVPCWLLALSSGLVPTTVAAVSSPQPQHALRTRAEEAGSALCETAKYQNKTRLFVLTDISNEPDDQMSLVRLLTYANELDIVNIAAVTSVWLNDTVDIASIFKVVNGYGEIVDNLNSNVPSGGQYPSVEDLASKVVAGHPVYGLAAVFNETVRSNASTALVAAVDAATDQNPQWISVWGGANVLAEALYNVSQTRSADEVAAFVRKMRVYSISDQDNAGAWIRLHFPTLFYIVSVHGFSEYAMPTWEVSLRCWTLSPPPFVPLAVHVTIRVKKQKAKERVGNINYRAFRAKYSATLTKGAPTSPLSPTSGFKHTSASALWARTTSTGPTSWKATPLPS